MSNYDADAEVVATAAFAVARAAEAMRSHTTLRLAQVLRQAAEDWPAVVRPLLAELHDALGGRWEWSPDQSRYLDLADDLQDAASRFAGRARSALHIAAAAVADLEAQKREVLGCKIAG